MWSVCDLPYATSTIRARAGCASTSATLTKPIARMDPTSADSHGGLAVRGAAGAITRCHNYCRAITNSDNLLDAPSP